MQGTQSSFLKNAKECKECNVLFKRMQGTQRSFQKSTKERKNIAFFWKERMPNPEYYTAESTSQPLQAPSNSGRDAELKIHIGQVYFNNILVFDEIHFCLSLNKNSTPRRILHSGVGIIELSDQISPRIWKHILNYFNLQIRGLGGVDW